MSDFPGVLATDVLFQDSPDAGLPECICSRCGQGISEGEMPIRVFVDGGKGGEYRYHGACFGVVFPPDDDDGDPGDFDDFFPPEDDELDAEPLDCPDPDPRWPP
jgi:hypothetical protein